MHRGFGGAAFEPVEEGRDREVTLGPTMLAGLVVALFALCAVCFLAGYATGHRSPAEAVVPAASGPTAAQLLSSQSKPNASQNPYQPTADAGAATAGSGAATTPGGSTAPAPVYQTSPSGVAPAVVQTALPAQSSSQPISAVGEVQPAISQAGSWMVQIAAVSHPEDADVLLSALRKRGYTVSAHRDPVDNLLHVQVGPFNTHNDAAAVRQKLLNDGYNAVIQP